MYIQCTKKMLAKLEQPYGELPNPPREYFCWHASVFEEGDHQYVVMMNDHDGEEVFFELDSFKDLNKKIEEEIQLGMQDMGATEKETAAYLKHAGPVLFGPTSDRSKAAQLGGFTRRMRKFVLMMEGLLEMLADPERRDELAAALDVVLGEDPNALSQAKAIDTTNEMTPMVSLDVELILTGKKRVKRSFLVPLHINFATLHIILQIGFGWYNNHLHEFSLKQDSVTIGMKMEEMDFDEFEDVLDENFTVLSEYIPGERRFGYLYDFGDSWEHVIKVGPVKQFEGGPFVICTGGEGSTPPEDCGGMHGYDDLCEVLQDPKHERYDELFEWAGDDFDVGFDQEFINEELGALQFIPHPIKV